MNVGGGDRRGEADQRADQCEAGGGSAHAMYEL